MVMKHVYVCSQGHEQDGEHVEFGHCIECELCGEVCVKVYPPGGGREWVVMTPEQVRFHGLSLKLGRGTRI